jgi:hypothetical protein
MNDPVQVAPQKTKPWWTVVGNIASVLGIIGLPLSIWLYFASVVSPGLTFRVNSDRAVVVKSGQSSRLRVTLNGKPVATDITAAQVEVWNSGRAPISRSDILERLVISTPPNVPILEASLRKSTRQVSKIRLDTSQIAKGKVGVGWQIMEKGDGAIIQIVYAGSPNTNITARASVIGQKGIYRSTSETKRSLRVSGIFISILVSTVFAGCYFVYSLHRDFVEQQKARGIKMTAFDRIIPSMLLFCVVGAAIIMIFLVFLFLPGSEILFPQTTRSPFDI